MNSKHDSFHMLLIYLVFWIVALLQDTLTFHS